MKIRARRQNLQVQVLDDETLVYDPEGGGACHVLNNAAATVWKLCDGRCTVDSLTDALAAATGLPKDRQIVELAIADLRKANLVEMELGPEELPLPPHGIERRGLMKRLGMGVGASMLLPAVDSMLAPLGLGFGGRAAAATAAATTAGAATTQAGTTQSATTQSATTQSATTQAATTQAATTRAATTQAATTQAATTRAATTQAATTQAATTQAATTRAATTQAATTQAATTQAATTQAATTQAATTQAATTQAATTQVATTQARSTRGYCT